MRGNQSAELDRIVSSSSIMAGRPCVRGTRVTVQSIVDLVDDGMTTDEIVADYPYLSREDVEAALVYAGRLTRADLGR
jgi:uncharacterized protein (DUF433 family)